MQTKDYLSCSEAAQVMGVSRSTVKRYCEIGELRNHKTLGGHRRIEANDVARWMSGQKNKSRRRTRTKANCVYLSASQVADALLTGKLKRLDPIIEPVVLGIESTANLMDHYLAPAMREIGNRWELQSITYVDERRATSNLKLLFRLISTSMKPALRTAKAVGGTLEGDHADLGSMALELVARDVGLDAFHVGTNLPVATFVDIAEQTEASIVWASFCHAQEPDSAIEASRKLREMLPETALLVIGGSALTHSMLENMEYDHHGTSCNFFARLAEEVASRNSKSNSA